MAQSAVARWLACKGPYSFVSLPRAVESYLLDESRKVTAKRGAFDMHLRRSARQAAAGYTSQKQGCCQALIACRQTIQRPNMTNLKPGNVAALVFSAFWTIRGSAPGVECMARGAVSALRLVPTADDISR